jgi:hypothetical protein
MANAKEILKALLGSGMCRDGAGTEEMLQACGVPTLHGLPIPCRPVDGFFGLYSVSANGLVWSFRNKRWLLSNPRSKESRAYPAVTLTSEDGEYRSHSVHVLVAKAWVPNPDSKPFVNHIDGNKLNFSDENLEWVTCSENHFHAYRTGLHNGRHPKQLAALRRNSEIAYKNLRKFSEDDVRMIRTLKNSGMKQTDIAYFMGADDNQILRVVKNQSYRWVA